MGAGQFLRPKHTAALRLERTKCGEGFRKLFVWFRHFLPRGDDAQAPRAVRIQAYYVVYVRANSVACLQA